IGLTRSNVPANNAAMKQADPVADSQLKSNFAFSGSGFETTGAARVTPRCRIGKSQPPRSNAGVVVLLIAVFIAGSPHNRTKMVRTANGIQAFATRMEFFCLELCSDTVTVPVPD